MFSAYLAVRSSGPSFRGVVREEVSSSEDSACLRLGAYITRYCERCLSNFLLSPKTSLYPSHAHVKSYSCDNK